MPWRGVLIAESLTGGAGIWELVAVTSRSNSRLEREESRGEYTFCNVEVADADVDRLLRRVAAALKSPGWYFHVERNGVIKVAYPGQVMEMSRDTPHSIKAARAYGLSIGIHPDQLCFERLIAALTRSSAPRRLPWHTCGKQVKRQIGRIVAG